MNKIIHKTCIVPAIPQEVYDRWTTNEGSILFFASKCDIELKIGGKYEHYFLLDNEPGLQGSEGCKVLSYIPNKMFSFSWSAPPHIPEVRNHDHKCWVVVLFNEYEHSSCLVELFHMGFLEGEAWDETHQYFENAWEIVLNNLKESFE